MDAARRRVLITQYKDGYHAVRAALDQLSEEELDVRPADGWTPREVAHHLADSEAMSYIRLRRLLAEDHPVIQGYDEPEYARRLHYDRPIESSLEVFRAVRAASAELLESLSEDEWAREGTHSESGRYTMDDWLEIYAAHAHDHAAQMLASRQ
jgi:DinB family protein